MDYILPYDEDLTEIFKPNTPAHTRYYGMELEICNIDLGQEYCDEDGEATDELYEYMDSDAKILLDTCPVKAVAKSDGSVGLGGFEIVTAPYTLDKYIGKLGGLTKKCMELGYSSWKNEKCGLHIHVNRNSLSHFQIAKICGFVYYPNNYNFIRCISQRHSSYAHFNDDRYMRAERIKRSDGWSRYTAINLDNEHTVEFRMFRGSLLDLTIYKNFEFVDAIIKFTDTCKASYNDCLTHVAFLYFLKSCYKEYPHLISFLINESEKSRHENDQWSADVQNIFKFQVDRIKKSASIES